MQEAFGVCRLVVVSFAAVFLNDVYLQPHKRVTRSLSRLSRVECLPSFTFASGSILLPSNLIAEADLM